MGAVPAPKRHGRPVRLEAEFAVWIGKAVNVMGGGKIRLAVDPVFGFEFSERAPSGFLQRGVDQLPRGHGEARMFRAQPFGQSANDFVIGAAFAGRLDELWSEQKILTATGGVEIVVLDEHGRRQHHVGHFCGIGHELFVHANEQILAGKAALDHLLVGGDSDRIGVLDQHSVDRRTAAERVLVAGEDLTDARLIEHADRGVAQVAAFDQAGIEMKDRAVVVKRAAAFITPGADDRGNAACRVHVDGAVARTGEAVAETKVCAFVVADQARESFDGFDRATGNARRPLRIARAHVFGEFVRRVGKALEKIPVSFAVPKQAMHDGARKRTVGPRADQHRKIGLTHRSVHVDVNGHDLGAALFAGAGRVRHHVDLGVDRIGAPDHDHVGFRHFPRIRPGELSGAGDKAGPRRVDADG